MDLERKFLSSPIKASNVIGTPVINANGDKLGDIKEIVIDPRSGRVAYAVVSFGGFLSVGAKLFAIPFSAFQYTVRKSEYVQNDFPQYEYILDVSKERLEAAPGFDPDHWPLLSDENWHRDTHKYYERMPYWE